MDEPLVEPFKRPEWSPLPLEGAIGVEGKVVLDAPDLVLALLRFGEHASIPGHAGPTDAVVACLEGRGFTTVGEVSASLAAGERTFWPAGVFHRLWTEGSPMTTLMVERPPQT
jgi:mannose-6-phosphate isomerase-like protein (cupin superfamily)